MDLNSLHTTLSRRFPTLRPGPAKAILRIVATQEILAKIRPQAFTLIELLVVSAIIGLLASLLMAGLHAVKNQGKSVQCISNLRQIGLATLMYADEHAGQFHHVDGEIPDQGQWTANPWTGDLLPPNHPAAYWGVAYIGYLGGNKQVFRCPSAERVDEWREEGFPYPSSFWLNSTYGINRLVIAPFETETAGPLKLTSLKKPQTTILVQDAAEQRMEGPDDSLGLFPGQTEILRQWRHTFKRIYPEREMWLEWYRHNTRCNTLWVAGHVTSIRFNGFDQGVDYQYYTGEIERP